MDKTNEQIIAINLQRLIEEMEDIKKVMEKEKKDLKNFNAKSAKEQAVNQSRVEYLINYLLVKIDDKSKEGLLEHKEMFNCDEAPTISQSDLLALELELRDFKVTLDDIKDNKVREIHIDWS